MKDKLLELGKYFKRLNQLILVFPVWIILGLSGLFSNFSKEDGWIKSEKNDAYRRMY